MEPMELEKMKLLYRALSALPPEAQDLLEQKYRLPVPEGKKSNRLTDQEAAEKLGWTVEEYAEKRIEAEKRFREWLE
ncbi:hypothetical protein [Alkalicoccus urumqiensis]|uniref:hypothetical protein n=1 Tax=Alkalicoccus urumqiensis TaxID=1548213 RepID=UPI00115AD2B1|nr:hypothetical protein [Alkalicoccus urumqiensis]